MTHNNIIHQAVFDNPVEVPADRYLGRSTAIALRAISDAMLMPGTLTYFRDHEGKSKDNQRLRQTIHFIVKQLKLRGFRTGHTPDIGYYVQFNILPERKNK
jgi:hypothetical protein